MKNKTKLGLVGLAFLALNGCGAIQRGVFEHYPTQYQEERGIGRNGNFWNYRNLKIFSREKNGGSVIFFDKNSDDRVDSIILENIEKGSPLEEYASFQIGQQLLNGFLNKEEQ